MSSSTDRPERLVSYIIRRLQTDIATRRFQPGARLSPIELAEAYDVSHIPVREALSSMAAKGYIVHLPSKGFFSRELTDEELLDLYFWRRVIESEAIRMAVPRLTPQDMEHLHELMREMAASTGEQHRLRFVELNRRFHFAIFERAGSPILLQLLNYLWDASAPYVVVDMIDSSGGQRDHEQQMALLEAGDVEGLIAAMNEHRDHRLEAIARSETVSHSAPRRRDTTAGRRTPD